METYNFIDHTRGDSFNGLKIKIVVNGAPLDLTGVDIKIEFRRKSQIGQVVQTATVGSGITVSDAEQGEFIIDGFNVEWKADTYYYDVQITKDGVVKTYVGGTWNIIQDVTE